MVIILPCSWYKTSITQIAGAIINPSFIIGNSKYNKITHTRPNSLNRSPKFWIYFDFLHLDRSCSPMRFQQAFKDPLDQITCFQPKMPKYRNLVPDPQILGKFYSFLFKQIRLIHALPTSPQRALKVVINSNYSILFLMLLKLDQYWLYTLQLMCLKHSIYVK